MGGWGGDRAVLELGSHVEYGLIFAFVCFLVCFAACLHGEIESHMTDLHRQLQNNFLNFAKSGYFSKYQDTIIPVNAQYINACAISWTRSRATKDVCVRPREVEGGTGVAQGLTHAVRTDHRPKDANNTGGKELCSTCQVFTRPQAAAFSHNHDIL